MTKPLAGDAVAGLIARLEALAKPSRVADFEIHLACVGDPVWPAHDMRGRVTNPNSRMSDYLKTFRDVIDADDQDFDFPRYTGSVDAALTAVSEDKFVEHLSQVPAGWNAKISDKIDDRASWEAVEAASPAIALCIAVTKSTGAPS